MIYVVSRHPGLVDWVGEQGIEAAHVAHLDAGLLDRLEQGDQVIGNLPVHLIARVCEKGVLYRHVVMDLDAGQRGDEMSAREMTAAGARLAVFRASCPGADPAPPARAPQPKPTRMREPLIFLAGFTAVTLIALLLEMTFQLVNPPLMVAVGAAPSVPADAPGPAGLGLVAFGLAFCVAYCLWINRGRILKITMRKTPVAPKRALIQGLSMLGDKHRIPLSPEALAEAHREARNHTLSVWARNTKLFQQALGGHVPAFRPWQQNIRSAFAHRERLERVVVLCTAGSKGSAQQFELFREFTEDLFRADKTPIQVHQAPDTALDFEDHDSLRKAINGAIRHIGRTWGIPPKDIAIDVTAGQKIFSITAAAVTFNHELAFTYVNNEGHVTEFDATVTVGDFS